MTRAEKGVLLYELGAMTSRSRDHARRRLRQAATPRALRPRKHQRARKFSQQCDESAAVHLGAHPVHHRAARHLLTRRHWAYRVTRLAPIRRPPHEATTAERVWLASKLCASEGGDELRRPCPCSQALRRNESVRTSNAARTGTKRAQALMSHSDVRTRLAREGARRRDAATTGDSRSLWPKLETVGLVRAIELRELVNSHYGVAGEAPAKTRALQGVVAVMREVQAAGRLEPPNPASYTKFE